MARAEHTLAHATHTLAHSLNHSHSHTLSFSLPFSPSPCVCVCDLVAGGRPCRSAVPCLQPSKGHSLVSLFGGYPLWPRSDPPGSVCLRARRAQGALRRRQCRPHDRSMIPALLSVVSSSTRRFSCLHDPSSLEGERIPQTHMRVSERTRATFNFD